MRAAIRRIARPSSAFGRRSTENQKTRICRRKSNNLNEKRKCCPPLPGRPYKQKLDGEDAMGLCPKPHQGGSPTLDPPAADVARHGSPAACRSCLDDAIHRFRAGQLRWPGCAQSAQQKTCVRPRKMSKLIFSDCRRFFFCPEALFAIFKLQAQIVCERSQADSPGAFFAAFFLRKKARIPLCQFLFVCF